ncbi:MAG: YybH family protein [Candidatus Acidiferrales bacterium]
MRLHLALWIGLLSSALLLTSAETPVAGSADPAGPEQLLLEWDAEFDRVTAEKGLDGFLSFLAEDAAFFPAGGHISVGPQAARAIWSGLLTTPGVSIRWTPVKAELARSGELGYTFGAFVLRRAGPGGEVTTNYGKYVTIWRKDPSGAWKVAVDIGTPSPAPEAQSSE